MQNLKPGKLLVFIFQDIAFMGLVCDGEPGLALRPYADRMPGSRGGGVSSRVVQLSSCKVRTEYLQSHSKRKGLSQSLPCIPTPLPRAWSPCLLAIKLQP